MNKSRYVRVVEGRHGEGIEVVRGGAIARDMTLATVMAAAVISSAFIVREGHRGIVTRFSEAKYQVGPGLHFKLPFIEGAKKIEVREKRSVEDLAAATKNQLPTTATVSVNWRVNPEASMDLYVQYGSLAQFEERILDPKLRQAAKAALSKFNADELIRNREAAAAEIINILTGILEAYPVTVASPQIENIVLPETYMNAVLEKERAREAAAREQYNLDRQKLEAQQLVQSAEAERDAQKAKADGQAYRITVEAQAEAEATILRKEAEARGVREVEKALSANPLFVEYTKAQQWNGQLPQTVLGDGTGILMQMGTPSKAGR